MGAVQTGDTLGAVSILVRVMYDPRTRIYSYKYTVANPATSTGSIDWYEVDISRPRETASLDMDGLIIEDSAPTVMVDLDYSEQESLVTAVGFPSVPRGWTVDISRGLRTIWYGEPMILPGKRLSGFIMQSKGLPAIRSAKVDPFFDVEKFPSIDDMPSDDAADSLMDYIDSVRAAGPKTLKTIGPTNLSSPFNNFNFLDTIKSYINQSRSLGWISDSTTKYKYLNFMDSAKAQLGRNDNRTGRATLDSTTANAQRDSGSVLTSEAYALIFFNVKHLIGRDR